MQPVVEVQCRLEVVDRLLALTGGQRKQAEEVVGRAEHSRTQRDDDGLPGVRLEVGVENRGSFGVADQRARLGRHGEGRPDCHRFVQRCKVVRRQLVEDRLGFRRLAQIGQGQESKHRLEARRGLLRIDGVHHREQIGRAAHLAPGKPPRAIAGFTPSSALLPIIDSTTPTTPLRSPSSNAWQPRNMAACCSACHHECNSASEMASATVLSKSSR